MTPTTPSANKGADAAGGPSPMTAAATLFASSTPTKEDTSTTISQTDQPTARSVDRAKILIDHRTNSMMTVELFKEEGSDGSSSDDDDDESSQDGFSDTDGASSSSDEEDSSIMTNDNDEMSSISDSNGYLQINVDGGTLQVLDGTITSPTSTTTKSKPTPARPRSDAIIDPSTPSPSAKAKPAGHTPDPAYTPTTVSSTPSSSSPPPPPPPARNNCDNVAQQQEVKESSEPREEQRSPAPGPFQYPPGIPRHKRERVLRPSPLPSPAKSTRRALWKRNDGSTSTDDVGSSESSSKKASSAAALVLAANMTPGTPKHRKRQVHTNTPSSTGNANTPRRSDSSGENGSSMLMTEEGRRKREEVQLARLVDMAKRQQRFAAAWFAASQGQDASNMVPPPPPPRHRGPRVGPIPQQRTASRSELDLATGPIDADSGEAWKDPTDSSKKEAPLPNKKSSIVARFNPGQQESLQLEPIRSGVEADDDRASYVSASSSKTPKMANTSPDKRGRGRSSIDRADIERGTTSSPSPDGRSDLFIDESQGPKSGGGESFWTREIRIGSCRLAAMNCFVMVVLLMVVAGAAIVGIVSTPNSNVGSPDTVVTDGATDIPSPDTGGSLGPRDDIVPISPGDKPSVPDDAWREDVDIFVRTTVPTWAPTRMPTPSTDATATSNPTSRPSSLPSASPTTSLPPSQVPSTSPTSFFQTTSFTQIDKALSGKESGVQFGYSVALSSDGSVMAVGSRYADDNGPRSGEVRVFALSLKNKWEQLGKPLKGRNDADQFGFSVSLSGDGLILAASEPGFDGEAGDRSGNVRIFRYDSGEPKAYGTNGSWNKIGDLSGEDSTALFGVSISLSGDGTRLAVGAPYHDSEELDEMGEQLRKAGRVRIFEYQAEEWRHLGQPIDGRTPSSWCGWSVSLSEDGNAFAAGAIRHVSGGYVQVYELERDADSDDGRWVQLGNDMYSQDAMAANDSEGRLDDRFGHSVSLGGDASRIIVGSPNSDLNGVTNAGMAIVYERSIADDESTEWIVLGGPITGKSEGAEAGWSVTISDNSAQIIVGAPGDSTKKGGAGSATPYRWNDDSQDWEPAQTLYGEEKEEGFGFSVAINGDGSILGVGSPSGDDDRGLAAAYLY